MKFYLWLVVALCFFSTSSQALALTISPTKIEVAGDPGQTIIGEIELFNEENEVKTFYTSAENFEPRGETGSPYFVGGGSGLASWISTNDSLTMQTGDRVTVPYTIQIPASAEPGGYFAAIFFGSQPPQSAEGGAEVSIGGKVGSIILLRVNGEVEEGGGLIDFSFEPKKLFVSQLPINFVYRLNNTGGDRIIPRGEIIITNTFGGTVVNLSANKNEGSVLPNSTRRFDAVWDNKTATMPQETNYFAVAKSQFSDFYFGVYTAKISLVWGESIQVSDSKVQIVIIPWQLLSLVSISLFIFGFLLKFYNRLIIARARPVK